MFIHLSIFSDIIFTVWQEIRGLIGIVCAELYGLIVDLYNVFMIIARADVLDSKYVQLIYTRVGLLLGLFMIFKLSFSLIQSLIDPDKLSDKKNGYASIITRSIVAIVLLGVTPTIFKAARSLQNVIVGVNSTNNVLYRVIVADDVISNSPSSFGQRLASDMFFSFFKPKKDYTENVDIVDMDGERVIVVKDYNYLVDQTEQGNMTFNDLIPYLSLRSNGEYVFDWKIILSVGAAIAVLWIFVNYCISVAIRAIQLAYLQIVAPIPILSYIGNPDGSFKKWIKQCTSTYLELFMRLGIIYFIITMCDKVLDILDVDSSLESSVGITKESSEYVLVKIFLIIGLLLFGKRVPDLIKELFPGDGKFDLGIKSPKKLLNEIPGGNLAYKTAKGAGVLGAGIAAGGVAGVVAGIRYGEGVRGKIAGGLGGVFRGAAGSAKTKGNIFKNVGHGIGNVRAANERAYQRHHDGSTFLGRMAPGHAQRKLDEFERENEIYTKFDSMSDTLDSALEKDSAVQVAMTNLENTKKSAAFQAMSRANQAATIDALNRQIKIAKASVVDREVSKERAAAGSGNAQIIAALRGMSDLATQHNELEGFSSLASFSIDDSSVSSRQIWHRMDTAKKQAKNASVNITQRGGTRNKEYEEAKANATYNKKK